MEKKPLKVCQDNTFEQDIDVMKNAIPRINLNSARIENEGNLLLDEQENIDPNEISFSRTLTPEAFEDVISNGIPKPRTSLLLNFDPLYPKNESYSSNLCNISENNEMDYLISSLSKLQVENKNVQIRERSVNDSCEFIQIEDGVNKYDEDSKVLDETNLNVTHNLNSSLKENTLSTTYSANINDRQINNSAQNTTVTLKHDLNTECSLNICGKIIKIGDTINNLSENYENNKTNDGKNLTVTQNLNTTWTDNVENALNSTYCGVESIDANIGDPKFNLTVQNAVVYSENALNSECPLNSSCKIIKTDGAIRDLSGDGDDSKVIDENNLIVTHDLNPTEIDNVENAFNSTYRGVESIDANIGDPKVNRTVQNSVVYSENTLNSECPLKSSCKIIKTDGAISDLSEDGDDSKVIDENNLIVTQNLNSTKIDNVENAFNSTYRGGESIDANIGDPKVNLTVQNALNSEWLLNNKIIKTDDDISEDVDNNKVIENNLNVTQSLNSTVVTYVEDDPSIIQNINSVSDANAEEAMNSTFSACKAINANLGSEQVTSVTENMINVNLDVSVLECDGAMIGEPHVINISTGINEIENNYLKSSPSEESACEVQKVNTENVCNSTLNSGVKNSKVSVNFDKLEDELSTSDVIACVKINRISDKNRSMDNLESTMNISEGNSVNILEINITDNQPESFTSEANVSENYPSHSLSTITISDVSNEQEESKNDVEMNEIDVLVKDLADQASQNDHLPMKTEYVQPKSMVCNHNEEFLMLKGKIICMEEEIKLLQSQLTVSQELCTNFEMQLKQKNEEIKKGISMLEEKNNNTEELKQNIKDLKIEEEKLRTDLKKYRCEVVGYRQAMDGYEQTMNTNFSKYEKLQKEYSVANQHLLTLEVAFSDVHQKYERSKKIIQGYKTNETALLESINHAENCLKKSEQKYDALKAHAKEKLELSNRDILKMRDQYESECHRLHTLLKRLEIKLNSQSELLTQKEKECAALTVLCDEVTGKV